MKFSKDKIKREINKIIVHAADTFPEMDIGGDEIEKWHTDDPPDGNGWSKIGYHFVIRRDGRTEYTLPLEKEGAHVYGHNGDSIGICMVGGKTHKGRGTECNYTARQWMALYTLLFSLTSPEHFPDAEVTGHNRYSLAKTCPNFDVEAFWEGVRG